MIYQLYYQPDCSKSHQAKEILEQLQCPFTLIDYLKKGLDEAELLHLVKVLHLHPADLIRQKDLMSNNLNLDLSSKIDCIQMLQAYPKLLQRPILLINNEFGIIARPPEKILKFIQENKL